ncbi:unnamed protein product [Lupinus luteus]|uniref:SSD domain-containing protein n=1 Tax=Lupinus luteus TaxID=3873 RepID=A0AAV1W9H6_LUPLU
MASDLMCVNMIRKYGSYVAKNPIKVLSSSLAIFLLLCLGLIRFKVETRPEKHYTSADQCLSSFKAPLDPSTVLGGFSGNNYSAASAFVVTYPVNNAIDEEGNQNAKAVAWEKAFIQLVKISYIVMFAYISLTLGDTPHLSSFYISSKVLLGLAGVMLVLLSVLGSVALFSAIGVKSTLIIMEVIPFLVLAVGVDNMCILVHAVKRQQMDLPLEGRISNALVEVGPSITLASLSEVLAFAVGSFISMPACRVFSMFAALAVLLDFILQVTAFVALIVIDSLRAEDKREVLAPILSIWGVKIAVIAIFTGFALASIALSTRIEPGLAQNIVLPRNSYLQGYFNNVSEYLRVGPPLYFVVKNYNYSSESLHTNQLCSISQCNSDSLLNEIARAALVPDTSYIAKPAASWLDDFLVWVSPEAFGCCRKFMNGSYCPPDDQPPCCAAGEGSCVSDGVCKDCTTCFRHTDLHNGRASTTQFREKLPWFLSALPSADCAKGGHGAYTGSVELKGYESGIIQASSFRTYHTPLNKQSDFVNSMRAAQEFCSRVSDSLKVTSGDKDLRVKEALGTMGASVFSGITLTKLVGVIVLCFSRTEVFVVYYFQMYLSLVLLGFLHGLVFLPVVLSIFGPASRYTNNEQQGEYTSPNSS